MITREMLVASAKAVGRVNRYYATNEDYLDGLLVYWKPHEDGDQAMRLMANLLMSVVCLMPKIRVTTTVGDTEVGCVLIVGEGDDTAQVMRHAIVEVAAKCWEVMDGQQG